MADRPVSEMAASARQFAIEARENALHVGDDDYHKRRWLRIASMWDDVAEGFERLRRPTLN